MSRKLVQSLLAVAWLTGSASNAAPVALVTERDASLPPPAGGGGDSQLPILTPDGRYVLFTSTANNLATKAAGGPFVSSGYPKMNVFRQDRLAGITTLVSLDTTGTRGGSGDSFPTAISDNGRYCLFESTAENLVGFDTNGVADVFLRDVWANVTYLVSAATNGFAGNNLSRGSSMTPDGRYVAFTSLATNLVSGDTNAIPDIFVRDMETGVTVLATPGSRGAAAYNPIGSESPVLSADGRYLAFYSVATNVVPNVTNRGEIYLRDLIAGGTIWVSSAAHDLYGTQAVSFSHVLSADGTYLAYLASSNYPAYTDYRNGAVLRYNLASGLADVVSTNAFVPQANAEDFHDLDMTDDGRFISFVARNGTNGLSSSIWRWDAHSGLSQLVSSNLSGGVTTNALCARPVMDASGRLVAYLSNASDLVTNSLTGDFQAFLTDVESGTTKLLSSGTNDVGAGVVPLSVPQLGTGGTLVVFESLAASLVTEDSNSATDIFARDWTAGTNALVSFRAATLPGRTPNGPVSLDHYAASQDGERVAFASEARNLVPFDTNGLRDVFVRDLFGSSNVLVSVNTNGGVANGNSWEPTISPDGRYVVFTSDANDLVSEDTNDVADVFLRDLALGQTHLASVTASGTGSAENASGSAMVGTGGRFILFRSQATNLVAGLASATSPRLFQRDMVTANTAVVTSREASATPDGRFVAFPEAWIAGTEIHVWDGLTTKVSTNYITRSNIISVGISPDAKKFAFLTASLSTAPAQLGFFDEVAKTNGVIASSNYFGARAGLRFSADSRFLTYAVATTPALNAANQVYRYDFQTKSSALVSHAAGSAGVANGNSDSPDISGDGRFVVYRSSANNLLATDLNSEPDVYLYDARTGNNELLSTSLGTTLPANNRSGTPLFSRDGRTLFFQTWGQDVVAGDFNQSGDVVVLPLLYVAISRSEPPGTGAILSWPNRPGEAYQAQFKDNPTNTTWQPLPGNITVVGNRATLVDQAPGNRIYRVLVQ